MHIRQLLLAALIVFGFAQDLRAEVTLTFYSHDYATQGSEVLFPHAFVVLSGTAGDKPVKASFGFTAVNLSPSLLWEPVAGHIVSENGGYIAGSRRHFSLPVSDAQYRTVLAIVARWRNRPQPSYDLNAQNCVTFVKEIAVALRLPASEDKKFIRSPKEFLEDLRSRSRAVVTAKPDKPSASVAGVARSASVP